MLNGDRRQLSSTGSATATDDAQPKPELVLLHGWGMDSAVWQPLLPLLQPFARITLIDLPGYGRAATMSGDDIDTLYADDERLLNWLQGQLPPASILVGYSLGGMLAVQLAAHSPETVRGVVTLASNQRFVATADYPQAMAEATFNAFAGALKGNAEKTRQRFFGLQVQGATEQKQLLRLLREQPSALADTVLASSLTLLARLDNRWILPILGIPQLHILGRQDALVPVGIAGLLGRTAMADIAIFDDSPHLLFWPQPGAVADHLQNFIRRCQTPLVNAGSRSKQAVRRSFDRAANSYDQAALLQRDVASELLRRLQPVDTTGVIVDLGCGTGFCSAAIARHTDGRVIAIDFAPAMIARARQQHTQASIDWLVADSEQLPLANNSADCVVASLSIQWCEDLPALLSGIHRVLKPGGQFLFSTFGPDSLLELRQAWSMVDCAAHVNAFVPAATLQAAVSEAGFASLQLHETVRTEYFPDLLALSRSLKAIGAHNVNRGRPIGLTGKQQLAALTAAYEHWRSAGGELPLSYQIYFGVATLAEAAR